MDAYQARFSKSLCDILENQAQNLTRLLVSTRAVDHADYTERVGHIKGIEWALKEARDLESRMDRPEGKPDLSDVTQHKRYED